jgi:hypothetical protein
MLYMKKKLLLDVDHNFDFTPRFFKFSHQKHAFWNSFQCLLPARQHDQTKANIQKKYNDCVQMSFLVGF